jgi:hypothetical protein
MRMEANPVFETLCSLKCRTMDRSVFYSVFLRTEKTANKIANQKNQYSDNSV